MTVEVSAVIVSVPQADPIVEPFRSQLDSGAALGVPAHITILYPFMPLREIDVAVVGGLRDLFASIDPFEIALAAVDWFGDTVVFVRPEPDIELRRVTELVACRWPDWPPYEGAHADPTPHLTIGDNGDLAAMRHAGNAVGRLLPLHVEVHEIDLWAGTSELGSWQHRLTFPLGEDLR